MFYILDAKACTMPLYELLPYLQIVGVNDWDDDRLEIEDVGASAESLPLVRDKFGCPALQVGLAFVELCVRNSLMLDRYPHKGVLTTNGNSSVHYPCISHIMKNNTAPVFLL